MQSAADTAAAQHWYRFEYGIHAGPKQSSNPDNPLL